MGLLMTVAEVALLSPSPVYVREEMLDALKIRAADTNGDFTVEEKLTISGATFFCPVPYWAVKFTASKLRQLNPQFDAYITYRQLANKQIHDAFHNVVKQGDTAQFTVFHASKK